jgi:hypothetical protein
MPDRLDGQDGVLLALQAGVGRPDVDPEWPVSRTAT